MADERPIMIVCGGGSGGLELCVRSCRAQRFRVLLVDPGPSHLWKPLLHEVAAGTLDPGAHAMSYFALAREHGFVFHQGALVRVDDRRQRVTLSEVRDAEGTLIIPERDLSYDALVLAIGGPTEYFGVTGAREHAVALDSVHDAEDIRARIFGACTAANYHGHTPEARYDVVIVGGGATGVELAAELRAATRTLASYGLDKLQPDAFLTLTVINADARLLPQLEPEIGRSIEATLRDLKIDVLNSDPVVEVAAGSVRTKSGRTIKADLSIWAAGVRGPSLSLPAAIERSRQGLIVVDAHLRTRDPRIFAIGDCAAATSGAGKRVPASAQAAHQQAIYLARHIGPLMTGGPAPAFIYRDLGALVSLGSGNSVIGNLMGFVTGRSYRVRGMLAMFFYRWLYFRHRAAILGWLTAALEALGQSLTRASRPQVKLH